MGSFLPLIFLIVAGCTDDLPTCDTNTQYCEQAGDCVNTNMHRENCGECGRRCLPNWDCIRGCCTPGCPYGQQDCNPAAPINRDGDCHFDSPNDEPALLCVNPLSDREHCGDCNQPCAEAEYCANGFCTACAPPRSVCANVCVDVMFDFQHCGTCDHPCTDGFCHCGECYVDGTDVSGITCGEADGDADSDVDGDVETDSDVMTDGDADADADTDRDADTETDADVDAAADVGTGDASTAIDGAAGS